MRTLFIALTLLIFIPVIGWSSQDIQKCFYDQKVIYQSESGSEEESSEEEEDEEPECD